MAKRTVVYTKTAAQQRRHILKYWVKRNGTTTYTKKLIKLTAKQIISIQNNPKLFKKADFPDTCFCFWIFQHLLQIHKRTTYHYIILGQSSGSKKTTRYFNQNKK